MAKTTVSAVTLILITKKIILKSKYSLKILIIYIYSSVISRNKIEVTNNH